MMDYWGGFILCLVFGFLGGVSGICVSRLFDVEIELDKMKNLLCDIHRLLVNKQCKEKKHPRIGGR